MSEDKSKLKSKYLKILGVSFVLIILTVSIYFVYRHYSESNSIKHNHTNHQSMQSIKDYFYTCPMHPSVKSDKPGSCPICGMNLVKKKIKKKEIEKIEPLDHSGHKSGKKEDDTVKRISLSPTEIMMANVRTSVVKYKTVNKEIEAFGVIKYDTNKISSVPIWIGGRIDKLYSKSIGDKIHKGQVLTDLFSPDLISAQKEYIIALNNYQNIKNETDQVLIDSYIKTIESAKTRLKYWGLTNKQIESLDSPNKIKSTIPIYSDYSGEIINIRVLEGNYVKKGDILFEIADFSSVWLEAEINESDISSIKKGQKAIITIDSFPEKLFYGFINYIYPYMDAETRTALVRIDLNNINNMLKPNMFAKVLLESKPVKVLTVPRSSILYTGKKSFVWIEKEKGEFERRKIKTGEVFEDNIQVLNGLKEGDKIVTSGGFLIDSEAQLTQPVHSGGHQH